MIEPGDTVVVRPRIVRAFYLHGAPPARSWQFCGLVRHVVFVRDRGETKMRVTVETPSFENKDWVNLRLCEAEDIVWVAGEDTVRRVDRLRPGSYGDHKDPRAAMARLAAEREAITGKPVKVRKTAPGAVAQLDSWMESASWQGLCPPGHYLGRHWGNFLDIGVWPDEGTEAEP